MYVDDFRYVKNKETIFFQNSDNNESKIVTSIYDAY